MTSRAASKIASLDFAGVIAASDSGITGYTVVSQVLIR
jgi:NADPH:quinone reductase-like Zn-dependent oxidoreductase